jgi:TonB family protein
MFRHLMCVAMLSVTASLPAYPLQAANSSAGAHLAAISNVQILSNLTSEQSRVMQEQVMRRLIATIRRNWMRSIPEEANPPVSKNGKVTIEFTLRADGTIAKMLLAKPSGDVALDRAAWGAITGSRYQSFPSGLDVPSVRLSFPFSYNGN